MERIQNLLLGENVEMDTNHIAQVLQDKKLQKHLNTKINRQFKTCRYIGDIVIGETLFVTSALATYLASENFRRLGYALLFGICVGLGLLTKWALIFYMLPLGAYALFMLVSAPSETCKEGEVIAQSPEIETATVRIGQEILSLNLHREVVAKQTQLSSSEVNEKAENSEKLVSPWLGVSVALLAALSLSGWWYWAAWSELVWKSSRDLAQNYSGLVCLRYCFS